MSLTFPQLSTGSSGQFPIRKSIEHRTIVNRLADGSLIRLADPDSTRTFWELQYSGLSDVERDRLDAFFNLTGGRLRSFLFLDPCGNLLANSEDLTTSAWALDGGLTTSASDSTSTIINGAQAAQSFRQTVPVRGDYEYCGSALLRATAPGKVVLSLSNGNGSISSSTDVTTTGWTVAACLGSIAGDETEITFGVAVPAGLSLLVRGLQLEAQPGRSGYRRTTGNPGYHPQARFDQDELVFRADGIGNHSTTIRLTARVGGS
ncbi:MAG: hypothetical protein H7039_07840 [Bryobacteraceae bacterium]|nr:hypothetical protein [Bryobacteraceae bacterium]